MRASSFVIFALCLSAAAQSLPTLYYEWMEKGAAAAKARLDRAAKPTLRQLESDEGGRHFPHAILAPAVLHQRNNDASMLALAVRIGDLLATEDEEGRYTNRLDHQWDTYMWLEAYRLLEPRLDDARKARWRTALIRNVGLVEQECRAWRDLPRYSAVYIGTSTNHFAQWAQNLYVGGTLFARPAWAALGEHILRRLATTEQSPEGFWGEYSPHAPTNGYSLLTLGAVGVYYEHSHDPEALRALQRATAFHSHFTWPNGVAIETINDRNREWGANLYGNFAFTHTAQGRGLAALIARGQRQHELTMEWIGRVAQNALYYHDGATEKAPQETTAFGYVMPSLPAAVGKDGPWMWCLSGITAPRPELSQWFLDRQAVVSVYHEKAGLIVIGANSKNEPTLATFRETIGERTYSIPLDGRARSANTLSLAYQRFYADVEVKPLNGRELELTFRITGRGPKPEAAFLTLQTPRPDSAKWRIEAPAEAKSAWPVHPYSPYRNGPDTRLEYAVGTLTIPLQLQDVKRPFVRPNEQIITLRVFVP